MDIEIVVHIHNRILLSYEKEFIWVIPNEVDKPKSIIQSEVKQKEKDKYCVLKHAYEIWKDGTDESICKAAMETWQNFLQLKKKTPLEWVNLIQKAIISTTVGKNPLAEME